MLGDVIMKKIAIKLEYRDKTYLSVYDNYNKREEKELIDLVEAAVNGKCNHISFKCENIQQYFPKGVLLESVIGLVYTV